MWQLFNRIPYYVLTGVSFDMGSVHGYFAMFGSLAISDNPMIDYNRLLDRKGFDFDESIPKFGIDYD